MIENRNQKKDKCSQIHDISGSQGSSHEDQSSGMLQHAV